MTRNATNEVELPANMQQTITFFYGNKYSQTATLKFQNMTATIEYESALAAPTAPRMTIGESTCETGSMVSASWDGATAVEVNPITGYTIQAADSSNNINWSNYSTVATTGADTLTAELPPA